jgi:hypothetical protein
MEQYKLPGLPMSQHIYLEEHLSKKKPAGKSGLKSKFRKKIWRRQLHYMLQDSIIPMNFDYITYGFYEWQSTHVDRGKRVGQAREMT